MSIDDKLTLYIALARDYRGSRQELDAADRECLRAVLAESADALALLAHGGILSGKTWTYDVHTQQMSDPHPPVLTFCEDLAQMLDQQLRGSMGERAEGMRAQAAILRALAGAIAGMRPKKRGR